MQMSKPHLEFTRVDMVAGWATPEGYPAGIKQKILASDINETETSGSRSRLLRFDPGVYTAAPFVHDHWEEVYLVSGDLIVGNDARGWAASISRPLPVRAGRLRASRPLQFGERLPAVRDSLRYSE
jgi:hypothetical protein